MRRIHINSALLFANTLLGIVLYFVNWKNLIGVAVYVLLSLALVGWIIIKSDGPRMTYTTALIAYTCATQFGLFIPYAFNTKAIIAKYPEWTIKFVYSDNLCKAVILGVIAVSCFAFAVQLSRNRYREELFQVEEAEDGKVWSGSTYVVGIVSMVIVSLFFAFHIVTGGMRLFSSYDILRESSAYNSRIYPYILIVFYIGSIYLAAAGKITEHKIGWILWLAIVIIFAFNGNRGEFMYALLAVLGMKGVEGKKITGRMLLIILVIVFLVIPFINSMRRIGIVGNKWSMDFNFSDAFLEMGMQIRMSVYCLDDLRNGNIGLLWGRSYVQPIINILTPFFSHTTATDAIRTAYNGFGFNQVIESYLNFKIIGILLYFGITGFFLGKFEALVKKKENLAYLGSITCILINAARNYFAFVPGQILIVTAVYLITKRLVIRK